MNQKFSFSIPNHSFPAIVVLIPHFNNQKALAKTIASLSYNGDMHIVLVDDGSREKLEKKDFKTFSTGQSEISIIELEQNMGIEKALNTGLDYILKNLECKYIARIDSGDLQFSDRLNKQVDYLEKHSNIGILGTAAEFTKEDGSTSFIVRYPLQNNKIKNQMGLRCCILHPTVMFRTSVLHNSELYPSKYPFADDYAMFYSLLKSTQAANLDEVLTKVAQDGNSISVKNRKKQLKSRIKIIYDNFSSSPYSLMGILYTYLMMLLPYGMIVQFKRRLQ